MRRTFWLSLFASVLTLLACTLPASAAIRITISDSVDTKVFYSPSNVAVVIGDIGEYDVFLQTTFTNFPGAATGGVLSQTINVSDLVSTGTGTLPNLTVTAEVIETVGSLGMGEVTGSNLTDVNNANLALFTLPTDPTLSISSGVTSSVPPGTSATGTVQSTLTVNGTDVSSLPTPVGSTSPPQEGQAANTPDGYTLTSAVVLSGANVGITGLTIGTTASIQQASSDIIPEPGTMVVWGFGALGLLWASRRRLLARMPRGGGEC